MTTMKLASIALAAVYMQGCNKHTTTHAPHTTASNHTTASHTTSGNHTTAPHNTTTSKVPTPKPETTTQKPTTSTAKPPAGHCHSLDWATKDRNLECKGEGCKAATKDSKATLKCLEDSIFPSRAWLEDKNPEMTSQSIICQEMKDKTMKWIITSEYRKGVELSQYDRNCAKLDKGPGGSHVTTQSWMNENPMSEQHPVQCHPFSPHGPGCYAGQCCDGPHGQKLDGRFYCPSTNPLRANLTGGCEGPSGLSPQYKGNFWQWNYNYGSLMREFNGKNSTEGPGKTCNEAGHQWCEKTCNNATYVDTLPGNVNGTMWVEVCKANTWNGKSFCDAVTSTDADKVGNFTHLYSVAVPNLMVNYCKTLNKTEHKKFCHDKMQPYLGLHGCKDKKWSFMLPVNETSSEPAFYI